METAERIRVEVVYALAERQESRVVTVPPETAVQSVIEASGILDRFPDIDLRRNRVGIFGRVVTLETQVHEGDRVEIYRPLRADPKDIRRRLAREGKAMGRGPE